MFRSSKNGWMTVQTFFYEWFQFFIRNIQPSRPVLLIMDGHASHVTIYVIKFACENGIHLLPHLSHILQLRRCEGNYNKAYIANNNYLVRVITSEVIASLVSETWPHSFTALNIMTGFKKTGIFPINPGEISDLPQNFSAK